MKLLSFFVLLTLFAADISIDKTSFFKSFRSNSIEIITNEINTLESVKPSTYRDAFLGAITMKKANFMKTPKDKIVIFKKGGELLEKSISKEPKNGEFRFLRLVIQENSPKFLGYNTKISEDIKIIKFAYSSFDQPTKEAVLDYSKNSTLLEL